MSHSIGKRKRAPSLAGECSSPVPGDSGWTINPYSYTPNQLHQFALAGITQDEEDPTAAESQFPHKPLKDLSNVAFSFSETDDDDALDDGSSSSKQTPRNPSAQKVHLDNLVRIIQQLLSQGRVSKAERAFGVALQLRPSGPPVDLRYSNLWALGAEIIMREGEEQHQDIRKSTPTADSTHQFRIPERWGSPANMNRLKEYFEQLIQQHPYDHRAPRSTSAVDFNLAMHNCEVYNTYAEQITSFAELDAEADQDDVAPDDFDGVDDAELREERRLELLESRKSEKKDAIRRMALISLRAISQSLDGLMRDQPYVDSHDFLKLRATVSLYLADLVIPLQTVPPDQLAQSETLRLEERATARSLLQTVLDRNGRLPAVSMAFLNKANESAAVSEHIHSNLPIR